LVLRVRRYAQRVRRVLALAALAGVVLASVAQAADRLGTSRAETLRGTVRADFLDPRGGRDRVLAGGGADRIKAFDGLVDRISCGPGADVVAADLGDRVGNDCETVSRRLAVDRISDPEFRHATHVEPDTLAFGSTLVSVYQVGRAPAPGGSAAANGYSTTRDGGRTWRSGVLPRLTRNSRPAGEWARASDPVIAYSARHGVWLASSLVTIPGARSGLAFNRSPDGVTWSDPILATAVTGRDLAVDKQWATCDNWPQSPNYGRCYLAYTDVLRGGRISLQTSSDGGLTWSSPVGSPDNAGRNREQSPGVQPVVRPDGELVIVFLGDDRIGAIRSTDGGRTLTRAEQVATADPLATPDFRAFSLPSVDVDSSGRVYVAWMDCRTRPTCPNEGADLLLARSSPDGARWDPAARMAVAPQTPDTYYALPGLAADPARPERLALTYYRLTAAGAIDAFRSTSLDAGRTWARSTRLTPESIQRSWLPITQYGPMIGDYISTSFVNGRPMAVIIVAGPPRGNRLDESAFAVLR
jgi:hypothetical protein